MSMFCFQCQETCKNTGCTLQGMCGKKADTANLQDELIQTLKMLALARKHDKALGLFTIQSLFMTITNANFDDERIRERIARAKAMLEGADVQAPLGVLSCENEDIRSLRELLTYGVKGIAAYADHAAVLGKEDESIYTFVLKALAATAVDLKAEELIALNLECGEVAVKTMALLDAANTGNLRTSGSHHGEDRRGNPSGHPDLRTRSARPQGSARTDQRRRDRYLHSQ